MEGSSLKLQSSGESCGQHFLHIPVLAEGLLFMIIHIWTGGVLVIPLSLTTGRPCHPQESEALVALHNLAYIKGAQWRGTLSLVSDPRVFT